MRKFKLTEGSKYPDGLFAPALCGPARSVCRLADQQNEVLDRVNRAETLVGGHGQRWLRQRSLIASKPTQFQNTKQAPTCCVPSPRDLPVRSIFLGTDRRGRVERKLMNYSLTPLTARVRSSLLIFCCVYPSRFLCCLRLLRILRIMHHRFRIVPTRVRHSFWRRLIIENRLAHKSSPFLGIWKLRRTAA